jgi:hypothetical protein
MRQYREERELYDEIEGLSFHISRGPGDHSSIGRGRGNEVLATEQQAASEWVLDCFAGHHITSNLLVMYNLSRSTDDEQVYRVRERIPWRGSVRTTCLDIPNVAYVPRYDDAASHVISVAQLASDHGLVTVFEPTGCYIRDPTTTAGKKDVGRAILRNGTYVLEYLRIGQVRCAAQCARTDARNLI